MQREAKFVGWFALALGCAGILSGVSILAGWSTQPAGSSCRAICGLALLFRELFGDIAGMLVGGLLPLALGVTFCIFGYRVLK